MPLVLLPPVPVVLLPPVPVEVLPPVPVVPASFEEEPKSRSRRREADGPRTKAKEKRMRKPPEGGERLKAPLTEYTFWQSVSEGSIGHGQKTVSADRLTRRSTPLYDEPGS